MYATLSDKRVGNTAHSKNHSFTMMKTLFLSIGMACAVLASASPPTTSVANLEPKVVSGVMQDDQEEVRSAGTIASNAVITGNNHFAYEQAYGRETVPDPASSVDDGHSIYSPLNFRKKMNVSISYGDGTNLGYALQVEENSRWRSCNSRFASSEKKFYYLDVSNTGLASATATPASISRHFVAWVTSYLSGSESRG